MKKTLLLMFAFLGGIMAQAQSTRDFTDILKVSVTTADGTSESSPKETTISITENTNGTYDLSLKNFILWSKDESSQEEMPMPVGNILLEDIEATQNGKVVTFHVERAIEIAAGDLEGSEPSDWIGPILSADGGVPITLDASMSDDKLYCTIDIDMQVGGEQQKIHVIFGNSVLSTRDFTDILKVSVTTADGTSESSPKETTISITENMDGTYDLSLKNFILWSKDESSQEEMPMPVGNIVLEGIEATQNGKVVTFHVERAIDIAAGDLEGSDPSDWIGPILSADGGVPITLNASMSDDKLYCTIDIDMQVAGEQQKIHVVFGTPLPTSVVRVNMDEDTCDVYNVAGNLVRTNVSQTVALDGLTRGIYIVNGKKILKK